MNLGDYFQTLKTRGIGDGTILQHQSSIKTFLNWYKTTGYSTGDDPVNSLKTVTGNDIRQYKDFMFHLKKPGTVNNYLKHLRSLFAYMLDEKLIPDNPTSEIALLQEQQLKPKWLNKTEQRQVRNELRIRNDPRETAILHFFLHTGAREDELCNVRLSETQISKRKGSVTLRGKEQKVRDVPLNKEIRNILGTYLELHTPKGEFLFDTKRSAQMSTRAVGHIVGKYKRLTKIDRLTPHSLRHTFGHNMIEDGHGLATVAELMGHFKKDGTPNVEMTVRYTLPGEKEKTAAVDSLSWF